jgi:anthranilate synthase/aminodeoxychorismate synthase-like glutamine amidotransferase
MSAGDDETILMLDNYDSFTHNVVQLLGGLGARVEVVRSDRIDVAGIEQMAPARIVVSPGPGGPDDAGVSMDAIATFGARGVPVLGVCLGMQCIGQVFGGRVVRAGELVHGKTSAILHDGVGVLDGIPTPFDAVRYHSLVVEAQSLPDVLEATAHTANGLVMALRHRELPVEGVQFHPESILSEHGADLMRNFLAVPTMRAAS